MIKLIDLSKDYLNYLQALPEDVPSETLWSEFCYRGNEEIYNHVFELYDMINESKSLYEVLFDYYTKESLIKHINKYQITLETDILEIIKKLESYQLDLEDLEIRIIVLIGNYSTNGIVTGFNGGTMFLFLEAFPDEKYKMSFLGHELLHVIHRGKYALGYQNNTLVDHLFAEGLACNVSERLQPGLTMEEYIEFRACEKKDPKQFLKEHKARILEDLNSDHWEVIKNYVSYGNYSFHRIGYYIGYLVVMEMLKERPLVEVISMAEDEMRSLFKNILMGL